MKILNNDGVFHNVHTFSTKNKPLNLPQPESRKKLAIAFSTAERIGVRCDVHGWMSAWIIAVDHPYYAVTDAEGRFTIIGVPPGTYTLNCWQELLGEQTAQVTVVEGAQVELDFTYRPRE